ncbi:gp53-like domain-containing protein [Candidatus Regiella insecticola]|uniref:gp53-like domain-containing protein n=1 Tax=Candidatus Regiella insecticola TaxID=138073 RepID=UPI003BB7404C
MSNADTIYYRSRWKYDSNWHNWKKFITNEDYKEKNFYENGWQKFPSGLMMQWGKAENTTYGKVTVTWPKEFPNKALSVTATPILLNPMGSNCQCSCRPGCKILGCFFGVWFHLFFSGFLWI